MLAAEVGTASSPDPFLTAQGRPDPGAAGARTGKLFERHGGAIQRLCGTLLRDRQEAEDAAQQTFLSAYRALLGGSEPREPAAWLATIARNECWARIRARMREPLATGEAEAAMGALPDPLVEAIRSEQLGVFWAAISALPAQQREALLLREFGGLTYDELGRALGVSQSAVESLLFRARARLRGRLQAAYAAFNLVGWVSGIQDAVARVLAGGGPAGVAAKVVGAPIAAKAVTAVVGVAVLAGGAVVGTQLDRGHAPRRHASAQAPAELVTAGPAPTRAPPLRPARPIFVAARPLAAAADTTEQRPGDGEHSDTNATTETPRHRSDTTSTSDEQTPSEPAHPDRDSTGSSGDPSTSTDSSSSGDPSTGADTSSSGDTSTSDGTSSNAETTTQATMADGTVKSTVPDASTGGDG